MRAHATAALLLALLAGCASDHPADKALGRILPGGALRSLTATGAPPTACPDGQSCYAEPVRVGRFDEQALPEASGLAVSGRDRNLLWLVDDRPGTTELWAIRVDGALRGRVPVRGLDAVNAESLAIGPCEQGDARPCLYIADTGDNVRARDHVRILRVPEPDLATGPPAEPLTSEAILLRYPDTPQDSEALLVDSQGVPYLVSKASFDPASGVTAPTRLYAAPGFADGQLIDLGAVPLPPPPTAVASLLYGNVVTGGDARPGRVLLRTYDHTVEYLAPTPDAPLGAFPSWPSTVVPSPWQPQAEAASYASKRCGYFLVGERSGDIWFTPCRTTAPDGRRGDTSGGRE